MGQSNNFVEFFPLHQHYLMHIFTVILNDFGKQGTVFPGFSFNTLSNNNNGKHISVFFLNYNV